MHTLPAFAALADQLLGTEPRQRLRVAQCGTALLLAVAGVAAMLYLVWAGVAPKLPALVWSIVLAGGFLLFFLLIRSGRNLAFADPSLTAAQMVFALFCAAAGYAIAGAGRGAVLPVVMVVFMFGMYSLTGAEVRRIGCFAVALFGLTMAALALLRPEAFPPAVEISHFMMIAVMVPAMWVLAGRLSRLRERMGRQKKDLATALARIQDLATRDELTGLTNRRHMLELMEQERQRGVRSGQTFCLAMLDLDEFRKINEQQGHGFGDQLLRRFAREALNVIRISDLLCRWDGEEFLLMLSDTRASLARLGLERMRERIGGLQIAAVGEPVQFSFSAGVTEHRAGESVAQTIERAEQALQAAKTAGRNRVVLA